MRRFVAVIVGVGLAMPVLAADKKKEEAEAPPVITAADREPLHEAEEALQADRQQVLLGQAAAGRLADRQKALDAAAKGIDDKCGSYGVVREITGRINCGKTKKVEASSSSAAGAEVKGKKKGTDQAK